MRNRFNANCFNNGANSISFPEAQQFSRALFFRDEKSFLVRVTSRVGGQKFQSETMLLGPVVLLFICCALVPIGRIYIYIYYIYQYHTEPESVGQKQGRSNHFVLLDTTSGWDSSRVQAKLLQGKHKNTMKSQLPDAAEYLPSTHISPHQREARPEVLSAKKYHSSNNTMDKTSQGDQAGRLGVPDRLATDNRKHQRD